MNKEKILDFYFNNNSLSVPAEAISEELNCSLIVTDSSFHIVVSYSHRESKAYSSAVKHSELSFETCEKIKENASDRHFRFSSAEEIYVANILQCGETKLGYVLYLFEKETVLPSDEDFLFCSGLIAKQLFTDRHCNSENTNTAEEILTDLLCGKFKNEELFNLQISGTFLSHFSPHRFAFAKKEDLSDNTILFRRITEYFHASHPFIFSGGIIIFLHEDHDIKYLDKLSEEFNLKIAVSSGIDNLYSIAAEFPMLSDIITYSEEKYFVKFEDNCAWHTLLKKNNSRICFIGSKIKQLLEYDIKNKSELCLTLYTYLICSHSLKKAGDLLFTHSNTISYRLAKIRDDFNIDTDNPKLHFITLLNLSQALITLGYDDIFILD